MDPILDNIDADIQAGLEYLEEQKMLKDQEQVVDPEAAKPEAPQPQKKVPYKQSQGYLNALNGIEPTEADLAPYSMFERADINSTWMKNARKAKDPSQYDLTDNTYEMFDAVKSGVAKTWSGVLTFPERVVDMASGAYEQEVDSVWTKGDFNGDGRSNSSDLVAALAGGGYENGPRAAVQGVPEPSSLCLLLAGIGLLIARRRMS